MDELNEDQALFVAKADLRAAVAALARGDVVAAYERADRAADALSEVMLARGLIEPPGPAEDG